MPSTLKSTVDGRCSMDRCPYKCRILMNPADMDFSSLIADGPIHKDSTLSETTKTNSSRVPNGPGVPGCLRTCSHLVRTCSDPGSVRDLFLLPCYIGPGSWHWTAWPSPGVRHGAGPIPPELHSWCSKDQSFLLDPKWTINIHVRLEEIWIDLVSSGEF